MKPINKANKEILISLSVILGPILVMVLIFTYLSFSNNPEVEVVVPVVNIEHEDPFKDVTLEARSAYVKNLNTGQVLYEFNADTPLPIASITKLMTALTADDILGEDGTVTIETPEPAPVYTEIIIQDPLNQDQLIQQYVPQYVPPTPDETFGVRDLISIMLVSSSNEDAEALAMTAGARIGEDPFKQFINRMNSLASVIGLRSAHFDNPTGLDDLEKNTPGSVASAKDVTKLVEYILKNKPELIDATKYDTVYTNSDIGVSHSANNTNKIVNDLPNILISKTGYTTIAGGNLVVVIDPGLNTPIAITVLGSSKEGRFRDVKKLADATISLMESK